MDDGPQTVLIILISLIFSAFFSGAEIAFVSANKLKIELDYKQGHLNGRILHYFVQNTSRFLSSLLVGNNLSLVIYGLFMAKLLAPVYDQIAQEPFLIILLQAISATLIVLVTAEFLPKVFFALNPNKKLQWTAIPLFMFYILLFVPTIIITAISKLLLRLIGVKTIEDQRSFSRSDLDRFVRDIDEKMEGKSELDNEIQILKNALEFSSVKAKDCMVPRTDIEAVEIDCSLDELKNRFIQTGYSKILIYRDNTDNVVGYVHAFELFHEPASIQQILFPVFIIPENALVKEILSQFTRTKRSIAVVVDEFGGIAGMVTVEDIIEEIFGEIRDEHDVEEEIERVAGQKTWLLSGKLQIDYLNEKYSFDLPKYDSFETLAGLVLYKLEDIPDAGAKIETDKLVIEVISATDTRIVSLKVSLK